jgi:hypothetical protein
MGPPVRARLWRTHRNPSGKLQITEREPNGLATLNDGHNGIGARSAGLL